MNGQPKVSDRVMGIEKSAIHEMTRLSKEVEDVAFLSWANRSLYARTDQVGCACGKTSKC